MRIRRHPKLGNQHSSEGRSGNGAQREAKTSQRGDSFEIVPIYKADDERARVLEAAEKVRAELHAWERRAPGKLRVHLDSRIGIKPGAKYTILAKGLPAGPGAATGIAVFDSGRAAELGKGGKDHTMPCHHALAEALHAYIGAAGITDDRRGWLFRTARVGMPFAGDTAEIARTLGKPASFIDRLVADNLVRLRILPSPACTDAEFLRRAHLGILGALPKVEEARVFASDTRPGKRARLVDALLALLDGADDLDLIAFIEPDSNCSQIAIEGQAEPVRMFLCSGLRLV